MNLQKIILSVKHIRKEMIIVGLIFIVWIVFFDDHNLILQQNNQKKLEQLIGQEQIMRDKLKENQQRMMELRTDQENLEKFAREQFNMKKENEDVFLVIEN